MPQVIHGPSRYARKPRKRERRQKPERKPMFGKTKSADAFAANPQDRQVGQKTWLALMLGETIIVPAILACLLAVVPIRIGMAQLDMMSKASAFDDLCRDQDVLAVRTTVCDRYTCDDTQFRAEVERFRIEEELGSYCRWKMPPAKLREIEATMQRAMLEDDL